MKCEGSSSCLVAMELLFPLVTPMVCNVWCGEIRWMQSGNQASSALMQCRGQGQCSEGIKQRCWKGSMVMYTEFKVAKPRGWKVEIAGQRIEGR